MQVVPCPGLSNAGLTLNTTATSDGSQQLTVSVTDAAGNTSSQTLPTVVVDNHGPGSPTGFSATLAGGEINLSWAPPSAPPVPIVGATVQVCAASCEAPVALPATGQAQIPAPAPGSYTLRLSLVDAHGVASPQATAQLTVAFPNEGTPKGNDGTPKGKEGNQKGGTGGGKKRLQTSIGSRRPPYG